MTVSQPAAFPDQFAAAVLAGDRGALDALLDDASEFVSARARVIGREQRLAALVRGAPILARLDFGDRDVRELGGTAVVRAAFTAELRPGPGRARIDRGVSTFVLVHRRAGWRMCHQHNSHAEEP